jgi:DNA polymerase-3 subunit delta'
MLKWHSHVLSASFFKQIENHHAYLFYSPSENEAMYAGNFVIKKILCSNRGDIPCDTCENCRLELHENPHVRIIEKNPELKTEIINVDQLRDVKDFIQLSAGENEKKIIFIVNAHYMNSSAANSLLKNLEEPPQNTIFILTTSNKARLLPTILSRTFQVDLPNPTLKEGEEYLLSTNNKDAVQYLSLADGNPFHAIDYAQNQESIETELDILQRGKKFDFNEVDDQLLLNGLPFFIEILQKWIYDLMACIDFNQITYFKDKENYMKQIVPTVSKKEVLNFYKKIIDYKRISSTQINKSITLDNIMLDYLRIFK